MQNEMKFGVVVGGQSGRNNLMDLASHAAEVETTAKGLEELIRSLQRGMDAVNAEYADAVLQIELIARELTQMCNDLTCCIGARA